METENVIATTWDLLDEKRIGERFTPEAWQALRAGHDAQMRRGGGTFDSRALLVGLAARTVLWPEDYGHAIQRLRVTQVGPTIETLSDEVFHSLRLTREAETVISTARELATAAGRVITTHDLLSALADATGNEATALLRAVTGRQDPWRAVRRRLALTLPEGAPEPKVTSGPKPRPKADQRHERFTALIYLLTRDHVPFGKVVSIVQELEMMDGADEVTFSNEAAAALARGLVDRLWD